MSSPSRKNSAVERISGELRPTDVAVVVVILAILAAVILTAALD
jgi:hypothetical protein